MPWSKFLNFFPIWITTNHGGESFFNYSPSFGPMLAVGWELVRGNQERNDLIYTLVWANILPNKATHSKSTSAWLCTDDGKSKKGSRQQKPWEYIPKKSEWFDWSTKLWISGEDWPTQTIKIQNSVFGSIVGKVLDWLKSTGNFFEYANTWRNSWISSFKSEPKLVEYIFYITGDVIWPIKHQQESTKMLCLMIMFASL